MKGGFLLAMLGAWIVTQVIGGEALQRLGVLPLGAKPKSIANPASNTPAPAQGAGYAAGAGTLNGVRA